uniref:N-alpha-acetyltransferase auxiliary subunit-like n=1 Tax=Tetraselmis sp. GSL018 TaxID=582737 RepID=A0A061RQR2_9CHLO
MLQDVFERFEERLGPTGEGVPGLEAPPPDNDDDPQKSPPPLVWAQLFLAQHHSRLRDTERALEYVEKVIAAAPGLIEGFSVKAKILKHAGDLEGAAKAAEKARSMDLADRYLNSTAAKAFFRAGRVETAESTAALFTKDNDQVNNLYDMQCMWYEIECGRAHAAKNNHGRALKNFLAVTKHFADFVEDQFDFHSYCIRKLTLRSYMSLLKLEDRIMSSISTASLLPRRGMHGMRRSSSRRWNLRRGSGTRPRRRRRRRGSDGRRRQQQQPRKTRPTRVRRAPGGKRTPTPTARHSRRQRTLSARPPSSLLCSRSMLPRRWRHTLRRSRCISGRAASYSRCRHRWRRAPLAALRTPMPSGSQCA